MNKVLFSLLAGVAIGVLVAPDKGSETLRKLRSRLNDYKEEAEDQADELAGNTRKAFNRGRSAVSKSVE
jgi:gas vesicle protein